MTKLWFRAKQYGYGWYPASREGWMVLLWYIILLLAPLSLVSAYSKNALADSTVALWYSPYVILLTVLLIWICVKTGEKARWRGGK